MNGLTHAVRRCAIFLLAITSISSATAMPPGASAYLGWWLPDGWKTISDQRLDRLYFFDIEIQPDGTLGDLHGWPEEWSDLRNWSAARSTPLELAFTLMDPTHFHRLFSNPVATQKLKFALLSLAQHPDVQGLHLDVEMYGDLNPKDIDSFRFFVVEIAQALSRGTPQKTLSVFLPFQTKSHLYDKRTLQWTTHVVLQAYDSHWVDGRYAGPVAPLDGPYALTWKAAVNLADRLGIPRGKQILSYPLYGYEWPVLGNAAGRHATAGKGVTTSYATLSPEAAESAEITISARSRVSQYGARFDTVTGSSSYQFTRNGRLYEGWFEDLEGLDRKAEYLEKESLGGIAFFILGYDAGSLVNAYLEKSKTPALR